MVSPKAKRRREDLDGGGSSVLSTLIIREIN